MGKLIQVDFANGNRYKSFQDEKPYIPYPEENYIRKISISPEGDMVIERVPILDQEDPPPKKVKKYEKIPYRKEGMWR